MSEEEKRNYMNALYKSGVRLRKCQKAYFKERIRDNLYAAKDAERDFDNILLSIELAMKGGVK